MPASQVCVESLHVALPHPALALFALLPNPLSESLATQQSHMGTPIPRNQHVAANKRHAAARKQTGVESRNPFGVGRVVIPEADRSAFSREVELWHNVGSKSTGGQHG